MKSKRLKEAILAAAIDETKEPGPGTAERRFCFPPDFIGFAGHFPGYPLLPAFVQMVLGTMLAEEHYGTPLELIKISNAKFQQQIIPDMEITVMVREKTVGGNPGCEAQISSDKGPAAIFTLGFTEPGGENTGI